MTTNETNFKLAKRFANTNDYDKALETALLFKDDFVKYNYIFLSIKHHLNLLSGEMVQIITNDIRDKKIENNTELKKIIDILNGYNGKKTIYYNETTGTVGVSELPPNFSMCDDYVGGSGIITDTSIGSIIALDFKKIICLLEEPNDITNLKIKRESYQIIDRFWRPCKSDISDVDMMNNILISIGESVSKSEKVIVHCLGGVGRTNVVLGCYLMKYNKLSSSESISILDKQRKVNLTLQQINFMKKYYAVINNYIGSFSPVSLPKFIILVGIQCSGKTTLSNKLLTKYGEKIIHINQDDLGKKDCITLFLDNCKGSNIILLDRCNKTKAERKEWLSLIFSKNIVCVYFDLPLEVCKDRMLARTNHPTLSGKGGIKILEETHKLMEPPQKNEGFEKVITVRNDDDYNQMLKFFSLN